MSDNKNYARTIWSNLKSRGLNDYAVAGIMGNLFAESGLQSAILETYYQKKYSMTSEAYTAAVDNGSYGNFVRDSAGYGLAQWTYWARKEALLNYKNQCGASIGDLSMQLNFFWQELQGYTGVMNVLRHAGSVREASDVMLLQYERPADQSEEVKVRRASYGQKYYDQFAKNPSDSAEPSKPASPSEKSSKATPETDSTKSPDDIAREVIRGIWGNGEERRRRLTAAGYDYETVRSRVNELLR